MSQVITVVNGDGLPKMYYSPTFDKDPAFDEAYDLLQRGTAGSFQLCPTPQSNIDRFDNYLDEP